MNDEEYEELISIYVSGSPVDATSLFTQRICRELVALRAELAQAREELIGKHEFAMSLKKYISEQDIVEELRLLADSMSTHKALAEKIGISEQYLCDILHGKRYPRGTAICKFLKIHAEIVFVEDK